MNVKGVFYAYQSIRGTAAIGLAGPTSQPPITGTELREFASHLYIKSDLQRLAADDDLLKTAAQGISLPEGCVVYFSAEVQQSNGCTAYIGGTVLEISRIKDGVIGIDVDCHGEYVVEVNAHG